MAAGDGLELVAVDGRRSRYHVRDERSAFTFAPDPFPTRQVRVVRIRMRCDAGREVVARLYWRHGTDAEFSEEKCIRIPLVADGRWHEHTVHLDQSDRRPAWDAADEIAQLRFAPASVRGIVELEELQLCEAVSLQQRQRR